MRSLIIALVIFCELFKYGSTIMCYECNSAINSLCSDAIPPESLKRNCSEHDRGISHTICRKIIQHVDHAINGKYPESRIIRSCGWDDTKFQGMCYYRAGYGGRQEVCSCYKDYCNAGDKTRSALTLLVTTIVIAVGMKICS